MTNEQAIKTLREHFSDFLTTDTYTVSAICVHRSRDEVGYYAWLLPLPTADGAGRVWNCTALVALAVRLSFEPKWGATQASTPWVLQHQVRELSRVIGVPLRLEVL